MLLIVHLQLLGAHLAMCVFSKTSCFKVSNWTGLMRTNSLVPCMTGKWSTLESPHSSAIGIEAVLAGANLV